MASAILRFVSDFAETVFIAFMHDIVIATAASAHDPVPTRVLRCRSSSAFGPVPVTLAAAGTIPSIRGIPSPEVSGRASAVRMESNILSTAAEGSVEGEAAEEELGRVDSAAAS
jgi:hypothetical protein